MTTEPRRSTSGSPGPHPEAPKKRTRAKRITITVATIGVSIGIFFGFDAYLDRKISRIFDAKLSPISEAQKSIRDDIRELSNDVKLDSRKIWFELGKHSIEGRREIPNPGIYSNIFISNSSFSTLIDLKRLSIHKEFENAAHADWSGDGKNLAFVSVTGSEAQGDLYYWEVETDTLFHLSKAGNEIRYPKLSPDGKFITYSIRNPNNKYRWDIAIVSITNDGFKLLTGINANDPYYKYSRNENPRWSPDGQYIIFCGDVTEIDDGKGFFLFLMKKDGSERKMICDDTSEMCDPSFSPNGKFIAFRSNIENPFTDIWIAPFIDGKCVSNLKGLNYSLPGFVRYKNFYVKKITSIGGDKEKAHGHKDPYWVNDEELMFVFSSDFNKKNIKDQNYINKNWSVRLINIFSGKFRDYQLNKGTYRNPKVIKTLR